MHLTHFTVKNFKSLQDIEFNPKKITILIGPNSSGKSSILQMLALVKQSVLDPGGYFRPKGDIIDLGTYNDIVLNHDDSKKISFGTIGDMLLNEEFNSVFGFGPAKFAYRFTVSNNNIEYIHCVLSQSKLQEAVIEVRNGELVNGRISIPAGNAVFRVMNLQNLLPNCTVGTFPGGADKEANAINAMFRNSELIKQIFENYYFVPPARTMDEYGLPVVNVQNYNIVNSQGQKTNLSRLVSYLSSSPPQVINMISNWTEELFGKKIKTRNVVGSETVGGTKVTIEFLDGENYNSIINDGSGTNQVILLLTLLGITPKGSVLGIEEPEIHLHPKAQADLAKILIDVSIKEDKQILFTTHSEHMLYPFLTSVASKNENSLKPSDLAIFYFDKDPTTKTTTIMPLEVDENGMISGGLKGFFEAEMTSLGDYLKALEK